MCQDTNRCWCSCQTGKVLLTVDAVPFAEGFTRDAPLNNSNPDPEQARDSTIKLLDLVEQEQVKLVIFGHERTQWDGLKQRPEFYS